MTKVRFMLKDGRPARKDVGLVSGFRFNVEGVDVVCKDGKLFRESDGQEVGTFRVDPFAQHAIVGTLHADIKSASIDVSL